MKKIVLLITLLCLQTTSSQCGFFSMIGMFASGIAAVNAWGDIAYPKRRENKHEFMKNETKEDAKYKTFLHGKALGLTATTFFFGYQFFKNFQK